MAGEGTAGSAALRVSRPSEPRAVPCLQVFEGTTKEFWVTKGEPELVVHSEVVLGNDTKVWMASLQWDPLTQTDCTSTQLTELDRANVGKGVVQDAPEAAASPAKRKREEDGAATGTAAGAKSQCRAYVEFKTKTEVDRVFETGISVGGTAQQKPFDAFWGMYWSELVDPWGTVWLICAPQPKAEAAEAKTE